MMLNSAVAVTVAGDESEVLGDGDDERPDNCTCWDADDKLPCWLCYRAGSGQQNPEEPANTDGQAEYDIPRRSEPAGVERTHRRS